MSANAEPAYLRCTRCALELTRAGAEGLDACPRCGTKGVPMAIADDVTIDVNWHELRILGIWAENYAASCREKDDGEMQRTVNVICGRIHAQHPERSGLTMTAELGEVRRWAEKQGSSMETNFPLDTEAEPDADA